MAVSFQFKRGSTAPSGSSFLVGEPAWDATNKRLYVKAADGSMVQIGATSLSVASDIYLSSIFV